MAIVPYLAAEAISVAEVAEEAISYVGRTAFNTYFAGGFTAAHLPIETYNAGLSTISLAKQSDRNKVIVRTKDTGQSNYNKKQIAGQGKRPTSEVRKGYNSVLSEERNKAIANRLRGKPAKATDIKIANGRSSIKTLFQAKTIIQVL